MSILNPTQNSRQSAYLDGLGLPLPGKTALHKSLRSTHQLDYYLHSSYTRPQHYTQGRNGDIESFAIEGNLPDFDKVDNILKKIGKILDNQDPSMELSYFEYYTMLGQLLTGGYKMYMGNSENPKDIQAFKKSMTLFFEMFVDSYLEDLGEKQSKNDSHPRKI